MSDARVQVAFSGMHPERIRTLYERFGHEGTLARLRSRRIETTDRVRAAALVPAAERLRQLTKSGIGLLLRGEDGYPEALTELEDGPDALFIRGSLPSGPSVAVVGTRRCTAYGRRIATSYGRAIAESGWPLISGLARGIDGASHNGTVAAGGIGVAVLGSGIDVMYPREHADLATALIAGGGAVISESPPGTPPEAWRFPPRNRIISGLARVVIVVEATVKGGALITAEAALRHGRQVLAVPGDIERASSAGCNLLIRDGAFPVHDPDDLVETLELLLGAAPQSTAEPTTSDLSEVEQQLHGLVSSGITEIDDLVARCGGSSQSVLASLGRLEMTGLVRADGPGRYTPS